MHLLERNDDGSISLKDFDDDKVPPYAILSHRWGSKEVSFQDMVGGKGGNGHKRRKVKADVEANPGYPKIKFCVDQAWSESDPLRHCWVDTCCIDKTNAVELQETINCMFRWYRRAKKCYVYLADVPASDWQTAFRGSEWFKRGWTLQELIAPESVEFFSKEAMRLGDKRSLEQVIYEVTGIPISVLRGSSPLSSQGIPERMAWMDKRETTRPEDKAYALFGIFEVCMPLLYGEGRENALKRLWETAIPS
jgi:hypothetical protein